MHADIHRKNIIVRPDGSPVFLDWELALFGDPVYDLAAHLHKMQYMTEERDSLVALWLRSLPPAMTVGWAEDLQRYLRHERIKSAVIDSVRYTTAVATGTVELAGQDAIIEKLTAKINAARPLWGFKGPIAAELVGFGGPLAWFSEHGRLTEGARSWSWSGDANHRRAESLGAGVMASAKAVRPQPAPLIAPDWSTRWPHRSSVNAADACAKRRRS